MTFKKGDKVLIKGTVLSFEKDEILDLEISTSENTFFVYSEDVQEMPKKVVIPKFVAEWIEVCKEHLSLNIFSAMDTWVLGDHNQPYDLMQWMKKSKNKEIFARAWLDGYEIEQEKLYTVNIPNPNGGLHVFSLGYVDGKICIKHSLNPKWRSDVNNQLTEAEIKQDFDWAWQWAKPVEE